MILAILCPKPQTAGSRCHLTVSINSRFYEIIFAAKAWSATDHDTPASASDKTIAALDPGFAARDTSGIGVKPDAGTYGGR